MSRAYDWPGNGSVGTSKRVGSIGPNLSSIDERVRVVQAATATTASAVARRRDRGAVRCGQEAAAWMRCKASGTHPGGSSTHVTTSSPTQARSAFSGRTPIHRPSADAWHLGLIAATIKGARVQ